MAFDSIWKQQLSLVSYGNAFLNQNLSFDQWWQHSIFFHQSFQFRDLTSQHLLAQHFKVWLEALKQQGVVRLSLHQSQLLDDENNPNSNVELLVVPHMIVSHSSSKKTAWLLGKELAEWYLSEQDFQLPTSQQSTVIQHTLWSFELSTKLIKRVNVDLESVQWNMIQQSLQTELFDNIYVKDWDKPHEKIAPFYGIDQQVLRQANHDTHSDIQYLPLIYNEHSPFEASQWLYQIDQLEQYIEQQRIHPYLSTGQVFTPEQQINLGLFSDKIKAVRAKFVVDIANHDFQFLQPMRSMPVAPSETTSTIYHTVQKARQPNTEKAKISHVIKLILLTIVICICAYYFGF